MILDFIDRHAQRRPRFLITEKSFDARVDDFAQIVVVPPEMAAVVMTIVECRVQPMEESAGGKRHRVAEKSEIQVDIRVDFQLSSIFSEQPSLGHGVVVQRFSLCF